MGSLEGAELMLAHVETSDDEAFETPAEVQPGIPPSSGAPLDATGG